MYRNIIKLICTILALIMLCSCSDIGAISQRIDEEKQTTTQYTEIEQFSSVNDVEEYTFFPYVQINNNVPEFDDTSYTESFEQYGELDSLGRCTSCIANIGTDLMPTEERGAIGSIKPTGWQVAKYDCVDGKYLYNRCHLIGYQLTAENANPKNLITGTRYLNVDGMLEFESMVADYVKSTGNHVLYRVTPIFKDNELVARGVQMEAYSIEDNGKGVQFNIYCYNVQPNIEIDYKTGNSRYIGDESTTQYNTGERQEYIVNTSSRKFHLPSCSAVSKIKQENKKAYIGYRENLVKNGYEPCGQCKP